MGFSKCNLQSADYLFIFGEGPQLENQGKGNGDRVIKSLMSCVYAMVVLIYFDTLLQFN